MYENERITYELSSLMQLEYPGDAKLPEFKEGWDHMVRHLRTPLGKRDMESIYIAKISGSDTLKPIVDRYDLLTRDDPENSYEWLSSMTDQQIEDTRRRKNVDDRVISVSGKKKKPAVPAKKGYCGKGGVKPPGSGKPPGGGGAATNPTDGKPQGGKPKGKGKGREQKGKGKGDDSGSDSDG